MSHSKHCSLRLISDEGEHSLQATVAKTDQELMRGLMGIRQLSEGEGMLFIYEEPSLVSFWMKNMLMSIDILFIGDDFLIKHIEHKVPPCETERMICPTYEAPVFIQYVLELPAGYAQSHSISIGDQMKIDH